MFALAGQLARQTASVIVTTSTHLSAVQADSGSRHVQIRGEKDIEEFLTSLSPGVLVVTDGRTENERVAGPAPELLARLADQAPCPVLIEADGSRMLPLKAPADHEPNIPDFVDTVVCTVGLSAIGKTLSGENVHRPAIFASLAGLAVGDVISPASIAAVLQHPQGGQKGIPSGARTIALLNQADTDVLKAAAGRMASRIRDEFDAVVVAALAEDGRVDAMYEPIGAVILAAGGANRMGQPKQLLEWRGKSLIAHAVEKALAAGCRPVVVVTGAAHDQVSAAFSGLPVQLVHNPDWRSGQSSSVRAGLAALPKRTGAALFVLADQPFVDVPLMRAVLDAHAVMAAQIIAPLIDERRGNPVLFDSSTFADFETLTGDVGARPLFSKFRAHWIPWHDARALLDIDTVEDYEELKKLRDNFE